ncbi:hypothetical protein AXG93_4874s1160 [Marchantia polymorpha subsp. ruderalis]|uniref:Uncharacterized protein n=1 Tax=Marchantia polymorpha subsp. ruderalis TaxID=1480154 RepID=A0A176WGL0_MARPO|nr:hypothetical protein AXG93_4874s1160 [Marchantia polymorpha subsp. ruderalis]
MAAPSIHTNGKPLRRRGILEESRARCPHFTNTLCDRREIEAWRLELKIMVMVMEKRTTMARSIKLHALRVPEVGLRTYRRNLILTKMDFLLWGWNWTSEVIVQEWDNNGLPKPPDYQGNPDTWQIWDCKKVLGRCADDDGDLTFDNESVRVTREEKRACVAMFKHPRTRKNDYRTVWYHDRLRRHVAIALIQILRLFRSTYMMTWQVEFVERALKGDRIHWARIFWIAIRQLIGLIPAGSACYLSPFLINFYRDREKEVSMGKKPQITEEQSSLVKPHWASKKDKGKAVLTEEVSVKVPPIQDEFPLEGIRMSAPRERAAEVLIVSSDSEEYPVALEEVAAKAVEDVEGAENFRCSSISTRSERSLRGSLRGRGEGQVRKLGPLEEVEACQTAYDAELLRVDELSAISEKKEKEYQTKLAARAKKSAEYKASWISNLELIEKLEAQCSELRMQRSQAEEQLCEVKTRLTEAKGKIRQLFKETRDALTARVERCLRGYVLWLIELHNRLWLREIEPRAAEMIAQSERRHRRLAKKLEV